MDITVTASGTPPPDLIIRHRQFLNPPLADVL